MGEVYARTVRRVRRWPTRLTSTSATRAIALGTAAQARAEDGLAPGTASRVLAGADRALAIGSGSVASEADTVSFGHLATDPDDINGGIYGSDLRRRLINVADGINDHDAATVGQLGSFVAALGGGAGFSDGIFIAPSYTIQGSSYDNVGAASGCPGDHGIRRSPGRNARVDSGLRART